MQKAIIGKKIGMTQIFDEKGNVIPVTVVEAGPCVVAQIKTVENDGYEAIQLGFGDVKLKIQNGTGKGKRVRSDKFKDQPVNITMPLLGHFKKADVAPKRTLREFRVADISAYSVGDIVKADAFAEGDKIDVTAKSKGKGYAGGIKRFGMKSGPSAHGSKYHRHAGSNGSATTPGRVFKGKKMPGHMGNVRVTVQNLEIVKIDVENNVILVKGAVPGPKKSLVMIKETVKTGK